MHGGGTRVSETDELIDQLRKFVAEAADDPPTEDDAEMMALLESADVSPSPAFDQFLFAYALTLRDDGGPVPTKIPKVKRIQPKPSVAALFGCSRATLQETLGASPHQADLLEDSPCAALLNYSPIAVARLAEQCGQDPADVLQHVGASFWATAGQVYAYRGSGPQAVPAEAAPDRDRLLRWGEQLLAVS